jgi:20S proteasome subunit beta 2
MAVFESSWRENMTEQEAVALVKRAVGAGVFNDLGSGSNIDLTIIRSDGTVEYRRNDVKPNEIGPLRAAVQHSSRFVIQSGVTPILHESYLKHPVVIEATATEMDIEG